jgi:hypothetical protein
MHRLGRPSHAARAASTPKTLRLRSVRGDENRFEPMTDTQIPLKINHFEIDAKGRLMLINK